MLAQQLRALTVPAEDLGFDLQHPHGSSLTTGCHSNTLFQPPGTQHPYSTQIDLQAKYPHTQNNKIK